MDKGGSVSNQRGVVLLATLAMMLALFVLVTEVNRHSRRELKASGTASIASELRATAVSGIHIGMAFLAQDGKEGGPTPFRMPGRMRRSSKHSSPPLILSGAPWTFSSPTSWGKCR